MKNKKWKYNLPGWLYACVVAVGVISFSACETDLDKGIYQTSSDPMIDEYMEENAHLALFLEMVDYADLRGMLHAYGTYTCFVPTNEAVSGYLTDRGLTLDAMSQSEVAELVKYHLVGDTLATADFTDSRLAAMNMAKEYISTKTIVDEENNPVIVVNRMANIVEENIRLGNGYIHVVDAFLSLPKQTISEAISELPDGEYAILKGIINELKEDGITVDQYYAQQDTLYISFLAQPNYAFESVNVSNKASLLAHLQESNITGLTDLELLDSWLGYHCLPGRIYTKDIMDASTLLTSVKNQPIVVTVENENVFLNRYESEDVYEEGIPLKREGEYVDYLCANGVIQTIGDQLQVVIRPPKAVYWDVADQPEIRALKGYRKAGTYESFAPGELSRTQFGGQNMLTINYCCDGLPEINSAIDPRMQYVYGDYLQFRLCSQRGPQWIEFKLPVLPAGKYKVWLCWRRMNPCKFRTIFKQDGEEEQVLPSVVNLEDYMPTDLDDDQMEAQGWKQYNAKSRISVFNSKNIGIIDVTATGEHTLRFEATIETKDVGNRWDMIQLIPVDEDQKWPRIDMRGDKVYQGTPECEIFPDDGTNCDVEEEE